MFCHMAGERDRMVGWPSFRLIAFNQSRAGGLSATTITPSTRQDRRKKDRLQHTRGRKVSPTQRERLQQDRLQEARDGKVSVATNTVDEVGDLTRGRCHSPEFDILDMEWKLTQPWKLKC